MSGDWISPKTARVAKNIWRIINTIASNRRENMLEYSYLDIILFLKAHSFAGATLSENCSLLGTDNDRGQISETISAPNGSYCYLKMRCRPSKGLKYASTNRFYTDKRLWCHSIIDLLTFVLCDCIYNISLAKNTNRHAHVWCYFPFISVSGQARGGHKFNSEAFSLFFFFYYVVIVPVIGKN